MDDQELRKQIKETKEFYIRILIYSIISIFCIIAWFASGRGNFWPLWVIVGFSISLLVKGIYLGQIPKIDEIFTFLKPEWEEEQFENLQKKSNYYKNTKQNHNDTEDSE